MDLTAAMWRAWPAAREVRTPGGWLLRETPGVARRRSNCAVAAAAQPDLEAIPSDLVQVAIGSPLDAALAARGWAAESDTRVLTAPIAAPPAAALIADRPPGAEVRAVARGEWARVWSALSARADPAATEREVLVRLGDRARYLLVDDVAAALLVIDPPWAGVFCMVVAPHRRREGLARALLAAVRGHAASGAGAGAQAAPGLEPRTRLYLQVEADNAAARRLYAADGFTAVPSLAYRYRRRIAAGAPRGVRSDGRRSVAGGGSD